MLEEGVGTPLPCEDARVVRGRREAEPAQRLVQAIRHLPVCQWSPVATTPSFLPRSGYGSP